MGAMATTGNPADFSNQLQIFLDRNFFEALNFELRFQQFAVKRSVPGNGGHTSVRFFRPRKANTTGINRMGTDYNEGVVPTNYTEVARGYVDCTLNQIIQIAKISDVVLAQDLVDTTALYTKSMGKDAALDFDEVCSNAMFANPAIAGNKLNSATQTTLYNSNGNYERFAGVVNTGNSANDFNTFNALSAANGKITRAAALGAITQLADNSVPMINGRYPALTAPAVIQDIRQDDAWLRAAQFDGGKLFQWQELDLDGATYIQTTRPWREGATYGTRDNTGKNYGVAFLGDQAFGTPTLSNGKAGGPGNAPLTYLVTKPDHANPAAQFVTLSAKAYYGAILLLTNEATDVPHTCLLRVKSTFNP